jgi:hypothetical protein
MEAVIEANAGYCGAQRMPTAARQAGGTGAAGLPCPGRQALPIFQNTVAGARNTPVTLRAQAEGCQ